jgi:hypothetical protein
MAADLEPAKGKVSPVFIEKHMRHDWWIYMRLLTNWAFFNDLSDGMMSVESFRNGAPIIYTLDRDDCDIYFTKS